MSNLNVNSEEYKQNYITKLINLGMPRCYSEEDYLAWMDLVGEDEERDPISDAEESFSYWQD